MKKKHAPSADTTVASVATSAPAGVDRGRAIGLGVVVVVVVFTAVWMYVRGRAALAAPSRPVPVSLERVDDARFDAQAWHMPADGMLGFVEIPAGVFTMGSDPAVDRAAYANERWSDAQNQGRVQLPTFYIARYETTVAQFADFVRATHRTVPAGSMRAPGNHPVSGITWTEALAYTRWLESQLARSPQTPAAIAALLRDGWRVSLPSEAQWEKAARGADGRVFPWGNAADGSEANFAHSGTMPVGSIECASCAFGLADMGGNVWEVTRSPFQPYPFDANDEARDPHADALFVMRGGAFGDAANNVRAATRGGIDPGARNPAIGFRLVLEKP
jgi:formylglycine-generating enzyme required for sulfatase activity